MQQQMPENYMIPSVVQPKPQAQQAQPATTQATPQAQANIPQYNTPEDALNAGAKEGDRVIIGGKIGTFRRPK